MRKTDELPDELYRSLKARAALSGVPMKELVAQFVEEGLRTAGSAAPGRGRRREPPPSIIPSRGIPIPALSRKQRARVEEAEDEAKLARSARR
ncbi:MAG: hypothetical protein ACREH9_06245 [Pseudomonadota bacterium]